MICTGMMIEKFGCNKMKNTTRIKQVIKANMICGQTKILFSHNFCFKDSAIPLSNVKFIESLS